MTNIAFLFPGQGSQYVGMGADLSSEFEVARRVFERADDILGLQLSSIMFGSGDDESDSARLKQTEITQPALFVHSIAAARVLEKGGVRPGCVAGHSLGEYSAITAVGAITFEDGLRTVRLRGELMAHAGTVRPGAMAAVIGIDDEQVEQICADASSDSGIVRPANYNSPGQIVISGDAPAVERAMNVARERGARRVVPLPVSGAFHSPLMQHAREGLTDALDSLAIQPPACPVYLNVTAQPSTDPATIRTALLNQLTSPVRWSETVTNMANDGFNRFVEVGAGTVLAGLAKRILGRDVETQTAGVVEDFE